MFCSSSLQRSRSFLATSFVARLSSAMAYTAEFMTLCAHSKPRNNSYPLHRMKLCTRILLGSFSFPSNRSPNRASGSCLPNRFICDSRCRFSLATSRKSCCLFLSDCSRCCTYFCRNLSWLGLCCWQTHERVFAGRWEIP